MKWPEFKQLKQFKTTSVQFQKSHFGLLIEILKKRMNARA